MRRIPVSNAIWTGNGNNPGSCETKIDLSEYVRATCAGGKLLAPVVTTTAQEQVPATAPQVQQVLPSYEGQNVVSVEIAGRPDLDQEKLTSLLPLRQGQPFSQAKSDQSIAALKSGLNSRTYRLRFARRRTAYGFCWFVSPHSISALSAFRAPRANLPTRACYKLPTIRHGDRIRLSMWRMLAPHSPDSSSRTATSKLK